MGEESHILLDEKYFSRDGCKYLVLLNEIFGVLTLTRVAMVKE